jgi:recombination protein RecR
MEDIIEKLTIYFKEFPGIGERQARRFVYFLLQKNPNFTNQLIKSISDLKESVRQCPSCFLFFQSKENELCEVCRNPKTERETLLVVEKDIDRENIKRSGNYRGMYFILGGLVPIVNKETPYYIRINELLKTVEERAKVNNLKEIILALSINPQGEQTDIYLRQKLNSLQKKYNFKVVSLGRGLSTGTELEYSDSETIKNALLNRH